MPASSKKGRSKDLARVEVLFPVDKWKRVRIAAIESGKSASDFIRHLVMAAVTKHEDEQRRRSST